MWDAVSCTTNELYRGTPPHRAQKRARTSTGSFFRSVRMWFKALTSRCLAGPLTFFPASRRRSKTGFTGRPLRGLAGFASASGAAGLSPPALLLLAKRVRRSSGRNPSMCLETAMTRRGSILLSVRNCENLLAMCPLGELWANGAASQRAKPGPMVERRGADHSNPEVGVNSESTPAAPTCPTLPSPAR